MARSKAVRISTPQHVGIWRKKLVYFPENTVIDVGGIPAYASVVGGGVHVLTAFNDSGSDTLDVGFRDGSSTDDPDAYATALLLSGVGFIALDVLHLTANIIQTKQCIVTCRYNGENNDATAGEAYLTIKYVWGFEVP